MAYPGATATAASYFESYLLQLTPNAQGVSMAVSVMNLGGASLGSGTCISLQQTQRLSAVLRVNRTLSTLYLHDSKLGDAGAVSLSDVLKVNATLTFLDLRSNSIGTRGAVAIAEALKVNSTLTELQLQQIRYYHQPATASYSGAATAYKNAVLGVAVLGDNMIGCGGATALSEALLVNSSLTTLMVDGNGIKEDGAVALAESLKMNTTLSKLSLSFNKIAKHGAIALALALKLNSSLTSLDLRCNAIDPAGSASLAAALKVNTTLSSLVLYGNKMERSGAVALAKALKMNTTIKTLSIDNNQIGFFGEGAKAYISEAIKRNEQRCDADVAALEERQYPERWRHRKLNQHRMFEKEEKAKAAAAAVVAMAAAKKDAEEAAKKKAEQEAAQVAAAEAIAIASPRSCRTVPIASVLRTLGPVYALYGKMFNSNAIVAVSDLLVVGNDWSEEILRDIGVQSKLHQIIILKRIRELFKLMQSADSDSEPPIQSGPPSVSPDWHNAVRHDHSLPVEEEDKKKSSDWMASGDVYATVSSSSGLGPDPVTVHSGPSMTTTSNFCFTGASEKAFPAIYNPISDYQ